MLARSSYSACRRTLISAQTSPLAAGPTIKDHVNLFDDLQQISAHFILFNTISNFLLTGTEKTSYYAPYASMPDSHTFVSYFLVFQMSAIPRVFGLQL